MGTLAASTGAGWATCRVVFSRRAYAINPPVVYRLVYGPDLPARRVVRLNPPTVSRLSCTQGVPSCRFTRFRPDLTGHATRRYLVFPSKTNCLPRRKSLSRLYELCSAPVFEEKKTASFKGFTTFAYSLPKSSTGSGLLVPPNRPRCRQKPDYRSPFSPSEVLGTWFAFRRRPITSVWLTLCSACGLNRRTPVGV